MSYKLVLTYTKTKDQDWSKVILNTNNSLNSTPDPRDNQSNEAFDENYRKQKYAWFADFKEKAGAAYIGWDREYIDNDKLAITYYLEDENVARILITRYSNNVLKNFPYTFSWKLYDKDQNEIQL